MLRGVYAMFIGLSVQHALDDDEAGHQEAVLTQVKTIGRMIIPDPGDAGPGPAPETGAHTDLS
jgi:hypothetical protein